MNSTAMNINEVGMTAFIVAYFRAMEHERPHPLYDDPGAAWFVSEPVREQARQFQDIVPDAVDLIRYRTCYLHDLLRRKIDHGVTQVVIIGAGFDMRPVTFRTEGVTFYDVDQPAVLHYKRAVLEQHGIRPWPGVPCNYLDVHLPDKLAETGFDPGAPTLFLWEGNTMYLPLERVYGFINQLREGIASFHLGFDYLATAVINGTSGLDNVTRAADFFRHNLGAPWITGFDDAAVFTQKTGLDVAESGEVADIGKRCAPDVADSITTFTGLYFYCVLAK